MSRHDSRHLGVGQKGGGFSKLTRRELTFADQGILHGLWQATEIVGVEEDVSVGR
jgi:hypothetical protein